MGDPELPSLHAFHPSGMWCRGGAVWFLLCCVLQSQGRGKSVEEQLGDNIDALRLVRVLPATQSRQKILCWVNTFDQNHDRAKSIKATWGKRCDKLVFMSNVEDLTIPTVRIVAPATHLHLWQKHRCVPVVHGSPSHRRSGRAVVRLLWREYGDTYDWIFKCDDDTYAIVENLRAYLASFASNSTQPLLLVHEQFLALFPTVTRVRLCVGTPHDAAVVGNAAGF
ncbi:hypothetical protein DYB32_007734 [Aphanomyces invadans]|uniref:N-acetylgalactosaminide beta-1,3-galactosyltransferase n=1 Tax=Aphanomyces invadans TaxID=157072 RepID=A0A3R7A579_9STRA|nr:hypothetical protein DYB32_007734 [Aphanomyces invadans]